MMQEVMKHQKKFKIKIVKKIKIKRIKKKKIFKKKTKKSLLFHMNLKNLIKLQKKLIMENYIIIFKPLLMAQKKIKILIKMKIVVNQIN